MSVLKTCPKCNFMILIQQINFETMSYYFICPKCGYVEFNE